MYETSGGGYRTGTLWVLGRRDAGQGRVRGVAIDTDPEKIQAISDLATFAVQCDATDERALKAVSVQNVDVAVVSIGENIEASILIVQTLKEMGIKQVIAKGSPPNMARS